MRVIIAGDRAEKDLEFVWQCIEAAQRSGLVIDAVLSGACAGVDRLGELWAQAHGVPVELYPADWGKYGRRAGPIRNRAMASYAHALIAVHRNLEKSSGTKSMIEEARKAGLPVFIYTR